MRLCIRRREFIAAFGAASALPFAAHAQQQQRMRRIGVLMNLAADDPETLARIAALAQGLAGLGWTVGRNLQIDYRWAVGDPERFRRYAGELVALAPDVIVAQGLSAAVPLLQATRAVPIVFVATDPVAAGIVDSLARPGSNATGLMTAEYSMGGKWLNCSSKSRPA